MNRVLPDAGAAGPLADTEAARRRQPAQRLGIDQGVVQNEIGFLDAAQAAHGPQLRIAGAGTNERDTPDTHSSVGATFRSPACFRTTGSTSRAVADAVAPRSEEHTSELQSQSNLVCRLLLEKKKQKKT